MTTEQVIDWSARLKALSQECFIVGPVTDLGGTQLPEGFDLAVTRVLMDLERDTFRVGSEGWGDQKADFHALSKSGIERIAIAAGATVTARRIDDRTARYRCEYEATAVMRMLDGTPQIMPASRSYDLEDGGSDYIAVAEQARSKLLKDQEWAANDVAAGKRPKRPVLTGEQLDRALAEAERSAVAQSRATMQRNCESKAKLRALRSLLGIASKYRKDEIARKPFAVLRAHFSGRSADPQLRRSFALLAAQTALGSTAALYGTPAPRTLPAPSVSSTPAHALPAPTGLGVAEDGDDLIDRDTGEVVAHAGAVQDVAPAAAPPAPPARGGVVIPLGKGYPEEGVAIEDAQRTSLDLVLNRLMDWLASDATKPATAVGRVQEIVAAVSAEIDRRDAGSPV